MDIYYNVIGNFRGEGESYLEAFDNAPDARAFAKMRAGDADCSYETVTVLEMDGPLLSEVLSEYKTRGF